VLEKKEWEELWDLPAGREDHIARNYIVCVLHQIFFECSNQEGSHGQLM
jgi:hypothetical protein